MQLYILILIRYPATLLEYWLVLLAKSYSNPIVNEYKWIDYSTGNEHLFASDNVTYFELLVRPKSLAQY